MITSLGKLRDLLCHSPAERVLHGEFVGRPTVADSERLSSQNTLLSRHLVLTLYFLPPCAGSQSPWHAPLSTRQ